MRDEHGKSTLSLWCNIKQCTITIRGFNLYLHKKEILDTDEKNPNITLWDFYEDTLIENLYWRCNACGRIYHYPNYSPLSGRTITIYTTLRISCIYQAEHQYHDRHTSLA